MPPTRPPVTPEPSTPPTGQPPVPPPSEPAVPPAEPPAPNPNPFRISPTGSPAEPQPAQPPPEVDPDSAPQSPDEGEARTAKEGESPGPDEPDGDGDPLEPAEPPEPDQPVGDRRPDEQPESPEDTSEPTESAQPPEATEPLPDATNEPFSNVDKALDAEGRAQINMQNAQGASGGGEAAAGSEATTTLEGTDLAVGATGGTEAAVGTDAVVGGTLAVETGVGLSTLVFAGVVVLLLVGGVLIWWAVSHQGTKTPSASGRTTLHATVTKTQPAATTNAVPVVGGTGDKALDVSTLTAGGRANTGSAIGDTHLRTFDGLFYNFQGAGEFVVVRHKGGGGFEVQSRYQPLTGSDRVSVTTAVAVQVGADRIEVDFAPDQVLIDGKAAVASADVSLAGGAVHTSPGGAAITAASGEQVIVQRASLWLSTTVALPESARGTAEGLLGNFDGNRDNDTVVAGTGQVITPDEKDPASLYGRYGESWRVTDQSSLFTYAPGESTKTFVDRTFPKSSADAASLPATARTSAEESCRKRGIVQQAELADCVLDVALTGKDAVADDDARALPLHSFDIAIGDTIRPDSPTQGEGRVSAPGESVAYRFGGNAGQSVAIKMGTGCGFDVTATVLDPSGEQIFSYWVGNNGCNRALGPITLTPTGSYLLVFSGGSGAVIKQRTGSYDFQLLAVPPPQAFDITFGAHVSKGAPGPGAGEISTPFERDEYHFTGMGGQRVALKIGAGCGFDVTATVLDPSGKQIFSYWVGNNGCNRGLGPITLPMTGAYTVAFTGGSGAVIKPLGGAYDFELLNVPAPGSFDISIGQHVGADSPSAGAGSITQLFDADEYRFNGTAGSTLSLKMGSGCGFDLTANVLDPAGKQIFTYWVGNGGCNRTLGPIQLPASGEYTITFTGGAGAIVKATTGSYDFTLESA